MRRAVCAWCCVWLLLACAPGLVPGAVTLPAILGDHMVLQAGQPLRIWGWAEPGEEVAVDLAGDRQVTHANAAGEWKVTLPRRESSREPVTMTVTAPSGSVTVRDILVGEVWLGSGQSNMGWPLHLATEAKTEIAEAKHPEIRLFFVPVATAATPQAKIASGWVVCSPETVPGFSAVLYFFGRELHAVLQQPVGLIASAVGGTRIEPWMPTTSFAETPSLAGEWQSIRDSLSQYSAARLEHLRQIRAWLMEVDRLQAENREFPDAPVPPAHPLNGFAAPTSLYNAMIHPIVPFTLRGV
ncbi:MAG: sialate O-acetylesterase, partial [Planctomycetaceae bacterium]